MGVLIPSAPVCALGQLPLISKGSLLVRPLIVKEALDVSLQMSPNCAIIYKEKGTICGEPIKQ